MTLLLEIAEDDTIYGLLEELEIEVVEELLHPYVFDEMLVDEGV